VNRRVLLTHPGVSVAIGLTPIRRTEAKPCNQDAGAYEPARA
jgi:hypothetical protein